LPPSGARLFRTRPREVFREDIGTMEQITGALKSGAMQNIVLSKQEYLLQQHYAVAGELMHCKSLHDVMRIASLRDDSQSRARHKYRFPPTS
jgi:hypothetical protein